MKKLKPTSLAIVAAFALLAGRAPAALVFSDDFSAGSTLNSATPTAPAFGSAPYHLVSSKAWSPAPTLGVNGLRFGLAANTNDFIQVQARFAAAPLSLMFSNDFIELTVVFTNTSGLFTQSGHVGFGLYNSGGVSPLAGGLNGSATNGSPTATGGAQRWRGYVARIAYSNGNHRLATRPAQSIPSQDLVTEGSSSQSYTNGASLVTTASTFTRAAGSLLTEVFRLTRNNAFTLRIESRLYLGGDTNGTLLLSQTATATGSNFLNSSFDSLAVGWRATTNTAATLMDIKSVAIRYVGPSPLPIISLNGGAVVTNECHAAFSDPGATAVGVPLAIAGGFDHNLALRSDGKVTAWGWSGNGQTNIPLGLSNVVAIAGGRSHSLALKSDGKFAVWGDNTYGQTNIPVGLSNVVAIAAGGYHNLALKTDGKVAAWELNNQSQTNIPAGLSNVVAIAAGDTHSLALKSDGTVAAWGEYFTGSTLVPMFVPVGLSNVVAIAAGGSHSLALKSDGNVVAWGYNAYGQTNIPVGLSNVVAIAGGFHHSLALKSDRTVVAWGRNNNGQTNVPVGLSNMVAIAGGSYHSLAQKSDGTIVAWGNNFLGQTDVPGGLSISLPVTTSGSVDTNTPGSYQLTYSATNSFGGSGAIRTVVVQDTLPPIVTLLGANPIVHPLNAPFVDPGATALDDCSGGLAVTTNSTVNIAFPGTYSIRYIATDTSGNSTTKTRWVQVVPLPIITLTGGVVVTNECHTDFTDSGAAAIGIPLAVAGGYYHSLALKSDGKVVAWGYNAQGQTNTPAGLSNVVAIAGGGFHNLALKSDGNVVAWGNNGSGQTNFPVVLSNVVAIAGGLNHSLALKNDGNVIAWGDNSYGQTNMPVGLSNVAAIAGGDDHSLALRSDGTVVAWGLNNAGQANIPVGLSNVTAIAGGTFHSLALKSDGKVVAWGNNTYGQTNIPVGLSNVVAIAGGNVHSLALKNDGTVVAWGRNNLGQTNMPAGLSNVVAIAAGDSHSLVLKSDGTIVAWGDNTYGQTNIPVGLSISLPVAVSGSVDTNTPGSYLLTYTATNSLGGVGTATRTVVVRDTLPPVITLLGANPLTHTMNLPFVDPGATALDYCGGSVAVTTNSTVNIAFPGTYSIRYIVTDSSGNAATNIRTVRVVVPPIMTLNGDAVVTNECHATFTDPGATAAGAPLAIAGGEAHSLALKSDGTVIAWGNNNNGQTNIPVGLSNVVAIAGGGYHSLALKNDGTLAAWGEYYNGSTYVPMLIPVGLSNVVAIAGGAYHSLALKSDGTVVAWGYNSAGQTNIPVGLSNVVAIARGFVHSLALKSDGKVAAWGYNAHGQTNIPGGLSNVVAIAGGSQHSLALKNDGTLAAWGEYYNGSTYVQMFIPVGLSNVVAIVGGGDHSLVLKSNRMVAAWGFNAFGQTNIPVGLSNVVAIAGGFEHNLALKSDGTIAAWGYNVSGQTNIPVGLTTSLPVTVSGSVDTNTPGSYLLTYTATNSLGGFATATRTVVVQDTLPPVITLLGANPLTHTMNLPFVDPGATALDTCAGIVAVTTNSTVNIAVPGTYAVTYAATDSSGNSATNTRTVVVAPPPATTITLNGGAMLTNECHAAFTDPGATTTGAPLAIAGGVEHSLALMSDGTVVAWGRNDYGQTNIPVGLSNVVAIAGGGAHSLALKSDGTVAAWGNNGAGQTNIPVGLSNVVAIAGGGYHSVALKSDGTVAAWGNNDNGQTNIPAGLSNVVAIAGGSAHSLVLKSDGTVTSWGWNSFGQTNIPGDLSNVVVIAAGESHNLALKSDGTVVAWGRNDYGQTNIPVGLSNVVAIAGGGAHSLALKSDGTVAAWGNNGAGQTNIPVGLSNAVAIAAGGGHNLALKSDGTVVAWGWNFYGQTTTPVGLSIALQVTLSGSVDTNTPGSYLLTYTVTNSLGSIATATRTVVVSDTLPPAITVLGANPLTHTMNLPFVDPGATALDICGGSLAMTTNSTVNIAFPGTYSIRYIATDSSGNTATNTRTVVVEPLPAITITLNGDAMFTNECHASFADPGATATGVPLAIASGAAHSLALRRDGTVAAWGNNGYGETNISAGLNNVVAIAGGAYHSLALRSDGTVAAWGDNGFGETTIPEGLSNVMAIAGSGQCSLALKSDGTVAAWGRADYGQTNVPVGLSNVVAVAGGWFHGLALKSNGTVVAWGRDLLGLTNVPVGLSNVVALAGGFWHSLALKSDGKVVAWGFNNDYGQMKFPAGLSNVMAIAGGSFHSLALKSDGTVAGWGRNDFGQRTIPEGLSNVVAIAAGDMHSLALQSDGTVVAWGYNFHGQTNVPAGLNSLSYTVSGSADTNTPGSYLLTYTATNSLGSIATATRTVVVQDTLPPVITLLGNNPLTLMLDGSFVDPGATALDACGGSFAVTTNSTVNTAVSGVYSITYRATDSYGNSNAVTRSVAVLAAPPAPTGLAQLGDGSFQFEFTNLPGASFTVMASTNLVEWFSLGPAVELPPGSGRYQFNDPQATNHTGRFYRVVSP